jgi:hypothetical protein
MMRSLIIGTVVAAGLVFGSAGAASADEPRASHVIELEPTTIVATRQQPAALYVLRRSDVGYEVRELRTSFVREVVRTTAGAPF